MNRKVWLVLSIVAVIISSLAFGGGDTKILALSEDTAQAAEAVEILSHSSYLDGDGNAHVVGEVRNNSLDILYSAEITAVFYDTEGKQVSRASNYAMADTLIPGQKSPFGIVLAARDTSVMISLYELKVSRFEKVAVITHSPNIDMMGRYHAVGVVENTGPRLAKGVEVIGTFYDAKGRVVATGLKSVGDLVHNKAIFEMVVPDKEISAQIVNYELQVQCVVAREVPKDERRRAR